MSAFFKKGLILAVVMALSLMILPVTQVQAASAFQEKKPSQEKLSDFRTGRLERIWAKQQLVYDRLGKLFDGGIEGRFQALIDRAKDKGLDVTALEEALGVYQDATKDAHPIYESCKGIINSHQGFDDSGKMTDPEEARGTVQDMGEKLREIKGILGDAIKELREAFRQFREDNWPDGRPIPEANGG